MASKVAGVKQVTFDQLSSQVQIRLRTFVYEHDAAVENAEHLDAEVRRPLDRPVPRGRNPGNGADDGLPAVGGGR
jgi:hypothetical protein